jgi:glycosyltransferase involved in cell wall biosynthesis
MDIVHVYDGHERIHGGKGSLPRIVWNVARRTAARGHDVRVVERRWRGLDPVAEQEGVTFWRPAVRTGSDEPWTDVPYEMVTSPTGLARLLVDRSEFALRALRLLRGTEADVVHVYLPFAANVLATVAPGIRDRMVFTAQLGELRLDALGGDGEGTETGDSPDVPAAVRYVSPDVYLAKRAAHTTVLNTHVRDIFREQGVPPERLTHVPNGVDLDAFGDVGAAARERVRERYGLGDRDVVLFVGTVMPRKGVAEFVRAAARVATDAGLDDAQFVVAGEADLDEAYRERVDAVAAEAGIEDRLTYTGYLEDETLVPLYAAADVFVLPSFEEGFGMVVSEAMAARTPAVASDISGVAQQVDDGESGLLVPPGDVDALTEALVTLLSDAERRRAMGDRAAERARRFDWERVTDQYLDVYRRVADESRAGAQR